MRIRYPFAGAFGSLMLLAAYIGLLPHEGDSGVPASLRPNDKLLHLITFFIISIAFYWILDTTRRRTLHLTIVVCTVVLGMGSEVVQALIPNGRTFDPLDVLANIVGSLGAVGLCTWYHKRMLERKRKTRYGGLLDEEREDVELGVSHEDGDNIGQQENGVTHVRSLEEEVDNWDENAVDDTWEDGDEAADPGAVGKPTKSPPGGNGDGDAEDGNKRSD